MTETVTYTVPAVVQCGPHLVEIEGGYGVTPRWLVEREGLGYKRIRQVCLVRRNDGLWEVLE